MKKINIIKPKPLKIKPIRFNFNVDTDRDGVVDHKDCMPFNPKFQHISKTTKRRLSEIPIYVTDEPIKEKKEGVLFPAHHHVMSKEAKRYAPVARQEMLSTIKKYPGIIGEMERQPPKRAVYTSVPPEDTEPSGQYLPSEKSYYIRQYAKKYVKQFPKSIQPRMKRLAVASEVFHEQKHLEQDVEKRLPHRMSQIPKEYQDTPLEETPWEQEAGEYMIRKTEEYPYDKFPKKPSGKEISKVLQLDEDEENE